MFTFVGASRRRRSTIASATPPRWIASSATRFQYRGIGADEDVNELGRVGTESRMPSRRDRGRCDGRPRARQADADEPAADGYRRVRSSALSTGADSSITRLASSRAPRVSQAAADSKARSGADAFVVPRTYSDSLLRTASGEARSMCRADRGAGGSLEQERTCLRTSTDRRVGAPRRNSAVRCGRERPLVARDPFQLRAMVRLSRSCPVLQRADSNIGLPALVGDHRRREVGVRNHRIGKEPSPGRRVQRFRDERLGLTDSTAPGAGGVPASRGSPPGMVEKPIPWVVSAWVGRASAAP